jgi:uncharacterized spore protein YtfJ
MDVAEQVRALTELTERASTAACLGSLVTAGERIAIPVAEVTYAVGFGWGGARVLVARPQGGEARAASGGGGGGVKSRGIAIVELSPDEVQVHRRSTRRQ